MAAFIFWSMRREDRINTKLDLKDTEAKAREEKLGAMLEAKNNFIAESMMDIAEKATTALVENSVVLRQILIILKVPADIDKHEGDKH